MYSNIRFIENKLSKILNREVTVKRQSFYIDEQFTSYAKIFVDKNDTGVKVDFYDLTEYDKRGRLDKQLEKLALTIGEVL